MKALIAVFTFAAAIAGAMLCGFAALMTAYGPGLGYVLSLAGLLCCFACAWSVMQKLELHAAGLI